jgi:hypothetical protein
MPLYFANIRHGQNSRQSGQTDRKEYQRSSATTTLMQVYAVGAMWLHVLMYTAMHAILRNRVCDTTDDMGSLSDNGHLSDELHSRFWLPLKIPGIMVVFDSNNPPTRVVEKLMSMGFSQETVKDVRFPTFIKEHPTLEDAAAVINIPQVNKSVRPTYGNVTPQALKSVIELIQVVSTILQMSFKTIGHPQGLEHAVKIKFRGLPSGAVDTAGDNVMDEEGEIREDTLELHNNGNISPLSQLIPVLAEDAKTVGASYFGLVESRPTHDAGFLCPFEPNYAQPDVTAIGTFLSRFQKCFVGYDGEPGPDMHAALSYYWTREIANTEMGQHLAHLFKALDLAAQTGGYVYTLFRPGSHFDGCILYTNPGTVIVKVGEGSFRPLNQGDLLEECMSYGFHGAMLEEIVTAAQVMVPVNDIKTMRQLQTLVMAGGEPSGAVKSMISKRISRLAFSERPEGINLSSMKKVFDLLSSDGPIPDTLYLHHTEFWTTKRVNSILSCFGERVPHFHVGNIKTLATSVSGKNAQGAKPYTSVKPSHLQVRSIPLATAATNWESMMNGGWVMLADKPIQGARVFRTQEGIELWKDLGLFLGKTVARYGAKVQRQLEKEVSETAGRKRGPDDDGGRETKRQEVTFKGLDVTEW